MKTFPPFICMAGLGLASLSAPADGVKIVAAENFYGGVMLRIAVKLHQPANRISGLLLAEHQNLTVRMPNRRFTRLTNAFSKKVENHEHSVALHFMNYNFCRIHGSLRVTPAMEAGIAHHFWSLEEVVDLLN